ncbi:MAG: hypothetical protein HUJ56_12305 [Erysipelotrichaceae bacterium]|nr:hypothetical protein [Erysipelotrichaceae bacterium]
MNQVQGYLQEIEFQKKMVNNLSKWLKNLMLLSSIEVAILCFIPKQLLWLLPVSIMLLVSVIACIVLGLGIYNGNQNIHRVIDELATVK